MTVIIRLNQEPDPEMFADLNVLMDAIDADKEVKIVVFESAGPDYFIPTTMDVASSHETRGLTRSKTANRPLFLDSFWLPTQSLDSQS